jgi:hypothetical protein
MYSAQDLHKGGVSPFGHPRINDRSHLPAAFRSVPRPSSPLGAKASTERPSHTYPPPPARRIQPHHQGTTRTTTCPIGQQQHREHSQPTGKSAPQATTRYHQLFFTMRNNNRKPQHPSQGIKGGFPEAPRTQPHRPCRGSLALTWRRSDSNRRPPACKAGALPTELRPQRNTRWTHRPIPPPLAGQRVWAREDLNLRPHAYQACALTN